jgi:hypothetical protein
MTLISGQLCVSSAAQSVTHVSALPSCAAHFLDLTGLSVIAASLEIL